MPLVKIRSNVTHRVTEKLLKAGDVFDASPAEMESFGDKFEPVEDDEWNVTEMVVEETEPKLEPKPISATRGAIGLAVEHGISLFLSGITGSGRDRRITKADVETFLNNEAEAAPNGDAQ